MATAGIAFPAGNDDFRAARNRCSEACRRFNSTPENADPDIRSHAWLDIVDPNRNRYGSTAVITHDLTFRDPTLKAQIPFVKPPLYVDYGLRVHIGGSTFINRGCMILDTPVADIFIGERCEIGPNCCIVGVTHAYRPEERTSGKKSVGKEIRIGDGVFIGANVTILPGVTIGDGALIGAGTVVAKDVPSYCLVAGVPATVRRRLVESCSPIVSAGVSTLEEALSLEHVKTVRDNVMVLGSLKGRANHDDLPAQPKGVWNLQDGRRVLLTLFTLAFLAGVLVGRS